MLRPILETTPGCEASLECAREPPLLGVLCGAHSVRRERNASTSSADWQSAVPPIGNRHELERRDGRTDTDDQLSRLESALPHGPGSCFSNHPAPPRAGTALLLSLPTRARLARPCIPLSLSHFPLATESHLPQHGDQDVTTPCQTPVQPHSSRRCCQTMTGCNLSSRVRWAVPMRRRTLPKRLSHGSSPGSRRRR